ncbi:MAG: NADPH:quinone oxidoreductase family protein [Chloroflexi bacterium]|nr:MAG: NADPH:quinone oxidoreductase family protein [Chloroflexota bacterium]
MKAIRINEIGGPEVMQLEEVETPTPQEGEVLIKVAAAGVTQADLAQRHGTYLTRTRTPMTLGMEVAGTVVALGPGGSSPEEGTRVVSCVEGGYAEYAIAKAPLVIPIPANLDFVHAATFPVQGIMAYQLLRELARLQAGESVLVYAAAGGVGTLALQLAKLMGAGAVICTAGTQNKLDLVRRLGADVAINHGEKGWIEQVKEANGGRGTDIILEMVGGKQAEECLQCLAPFGRMVIYGRVSGEIARFSDLQLIYENQAIMGYWFTGWMRSRPERTAVAARELMQYLATAQLEIIAEHTFPLAEAAEAHRALAQRRTTGEVVLLV